MAVLRSRGVLSPRKERRATEALRGSERANREAGSSGRVTGR